MIQKNTSKVLRFLLRNPHKVGYNINQIARALEISVGSAFKILKGLEKIGIVKVSDIGNAKYYLLNLSNPEARKISELMLLEEKRNISGHARIYAEMIEGFKDAEMMVLFGSVLKKKEFNDVDVLFIAENFKKVTSFCLEITKIRSKPVVPLILKRQDLVSELKSRKESIMSIIKEGIVLKGESLFVEVIRDAQG